MPETAAKLFVIGYSLLVNRNGFAYFILKLAVPGL